MKLKLIHLPLYAIYLVLFKVYAVPQIVQQGYKVLLLAGILVYLIFHVPFRKLLNESLFFGGAVVLASGLGYLSGAIALSGVFHSLLYALCLYALYALLRHCSEKDCMNDAVDCFWRMTGVFCLISLISIALQGTSNDGTSITYFFGNKFATSYYFLFFAALFYMRCHEKIKQRLRYKLIYLALALLAVVISDLVYCTTAVLSALVLVVLPFLPRWVTRKLANPWVVLVSMLVAGIIPFLITPILSLKPVQFVIVDLLGENMVLTGRSRIYSMLAEVILHRPLFGYGYANTAVADAVSFGNAQNGLLQMIVDYGILGGLFFILLVWRSLKAADKTRRSDALTVLAYAMIVASIVEISYNYIFFMAIFMLRWSQTRRSELSQNGISVTADPSPSNPKPTN